MKALYRMIMIIGLIVSVVSTQAVAADNKASVPTVSKTAATTAALPAAAKAESVPATSSKAPVNDPNIPAEVKKEKSKEELVKYISETVLKRKDILVNGLVVHDEGNGPEVFFNGMRLEDLDLKTLTGISIQVHQQVTIKNTENIQRQLETANQRANLDRTQRMTDQLRIPTTPRVPQLPPRSPEVKRPTQAPQLPQTPQVPRTPSVPRTPGK